MLRFVFQGEQLLAEASLYGVALEWWGLDGRVGGGGGEGRVEFQYVRNRDLLLNYTNMWWGLDLREGGR
jgi:hypothetical protein